MAADVVVGVFDQIECQKGEAPLQLALEKLDERYALFQSKNEIITIFDKIGMGKQSSTVFISLGMQNRTDVETTLEGGVLQRVEKKYTHLILSPLGLPYFTDSVKLSFSEKALSYEKSRREGLFGLPVKTKCTYDIK